MPDLLKRITGQQQGSKLMLLLVVLILSFSACSPPRRLAKEFISKEDKVSIMLMPTDVVYKENQRINRNELPDSLTQAETDSVIYNRSKYLQYISDSVFLETYLNSFIDGLYEYGFDVYTPQYMESFLQKDSMAYMLNVSQIELEEYVRKETEEAYFSEDYFYKEFDLNAVNINTWFELSKVNSDESEVLYASHYVTDDLKGHYREVYEGQHQFIYKIDTMPVDAVYKLSEMLGRKYAGYLYDYLMNRYISNNLPQGVRPAYLYHYDRRKDRIRIAWEKGGFIELDQ
ncbi:MAG: hypothetical protein K9I94_04455 [Bacteroidales bacterium]|nr:hypothetical protein [Bacteroidales bacterium]